VNSSTLVHGARCGLITLIAMVLAQSAAADIIGNVLVYLTYSDRIIEGSPKNSVTVVAIAPWQTPTPAPTAPQSAK